MALEGGGLETTKTTQKVDFVDFLVLDRQKITSQKNPNSKIDTNNQQKMPPKPNKKKI